MKHHRTNVDLEFDNPAGIFYSLLHDLFFKFSSHRKFYCVVRIQYFKPLHQLVFIYFFFEIWQLDGKMWCIEKWNVAKMVTYFSSYMRLKLGADITNYAEYIINDCKKLVSAFWIIRTNQSNTHWSNYHTCINFFCLFCKPLV